MVKRYLTEGRRARAGTHPRAFHRCVNVDKYPPWTLLVRRKTPQVSRCIFLTSLQTETSEDVGEALCVRRAGDAEPSNLLHRDVLDVYKRDAPQLLNELSLVLSKLEGPSPQGIANILDCTWEDLTAGALVSSRALTLKSAEPVRKAPPNPETPKKHTPIQEPPKGATFSLLQRSHKHPGWITQPSSDEPDWIRSCQRAMEVLRITRNPMKIKITIEDLNEHLVCHYYDEKAEVRRSSERRALPPGTMPAALRSKPVDLPAERKFHYKFSDGSSFIYYPSGRMAVCHSCSALPCGGFYTNVFSDEGRPAILATVTPFGHGSVTDLSSGTVSAMWDQEGGFKSDQHGILTKEWRWLTGVTQMERIVLQVSDQISVMLRSGTSATLMFRWNKSRADILLPVVATRYQPEARACLKTDMRFISATARELRKKQRSSTLDPKRKKENPQEEPEGLEQWRQGGVSARKVKRLRQRVQNILGDWLDYYRRATGIRCPNLIRMPDARLRNQVRRAVQEADPSFLSTHEHADIKPAQDKGLLRPEIMSVSPVLQCSAVPLLFKSSPSCAACPVLLRAALRGEGGHRRCCCSATVMPVVTDLEYDALIMGQPPQSHQILVVCVTPPCQPVGTCPEFDLDVLDQLYGGMNLHRTTPCTQCHLDSFRLVRYEMPTRMFGGGLETLLLHRRHNAAPGMFLMYIHGQLLFLGFVFNAHHRTAKDLLKEICRVRGDYRSGLRLPADYKYSDPVHTSAATVADRPHTRTESAPDPEILRASNLLHPVPEDSPSGL
ncbi:uncharacterized protein C3orf20-like isoform X3 [Takifugu flavidus]|uniref:uncharacterized protein C3orf20-like isoform X3 n=1 Tax=Takifugu flavidus TaxID=433684 RepID=UPI0025440DF0|nr:uncharacterized protein C3orf20-like isoform X3 [Takifugu flavidus]